MKVIEKSITEKQFIHLVKKKFKAQVNLEALYKLKHNAQLCMIRNEEKQTETFYFLKKFYFKEFTLGYSLNDKIKVGKEIMISNFPLPAGPVDPVQRQKWEKSKNVLDKKEKKIRSVPIQPNPTFLA